MIFLYGIVMPLGFSFASFFQGAYLSDSHLAGSDFGLSFGPQSPYKPDFSMRATE